MTNATPPKLHRLLSLQLSHQLWSSPNPPESLFGPSAPRKVGIHRPAPPLPLNPLKTRSSISSPTGLLQRLKVVLSRGDDSETLWLYPAQKP